MTILDLNQEIRDLCDADTTSYPAATLLRRVNNALEILVGKIINADGTWQFDDTNYTTTPVGTGTLVSGQSSYSFADEFLDIETVKIKDVNGNWIILDPIDQSQDDEALEQRLSVSGVTITGIPTHYEKNGDTVRLYPAPTATYVTLTNGLKVEFKRTADIFTAAQVTTGTKIPGIASPYHMLVAYMSAIPYCMSYKKDRVALYEKKAMELEKDMLDFYSSREKDKRKIMTMKQISHI